jgi:hypothetical protein
VKKPNLLLFALATFATSSFSANNETKVRDLSKYKITGNIAHAFDTNKGWIYDERNPVLNFCFEDEKGNKARADFQCHMKTIGLSSSLSLHYYFARFFGASFSLEDAKNGPIDLGMGGFIESQIFKGIKTKTVAIVPGQPPLSVKYPTFVLNGFIQLGIHIAKLKSHQGTFVLASPSFFISQGIGVVTGGNLTMIGKPVFEDAPENSKSATLESVAKTETKAKG